MAVTDLTQLLTMVRTAAGIIMRDNSMLSVDQALDQLQGLVKKTKTANSTDHVPYKFLQVLVDAEIPDSFYAEIKASTQVTHEVVKRTASICNLMKLLKFNAEEMFAKFISRTSMEYFDYLTNKMLSFAARISQEMKDGTNTMQEAITFIAKPGHNRHISGITIDQVNFLLSEQMIFELYMHAKVDLIVNVDLYEERRYDHKALCENARFHVAHQDKEYLTADHGLETLGFTIAETNKFLTDYASKEAINVLNKKIADMTVILQEIQSLMELRKMSYEKAKDQVFKHLTQAMAIKDADYELLLSSKRKSSLNMGMFESFRDSPEDYVSLITDTTPKIEVAPKFMVVQSPANMNLPNNNLLPGINNSSLVLGLSSSALFMLCMLCYCKPTFITGSISLINRAGNKVLGCLTNAMKKEVAHDDENKTMRLNVLAPALMP